MTKQQLVVIGGGYAGVSAAMEGVKRGYQVTLLEERPYLGGRAHSFLEKRSNELTDNGQHLFMGCYSRALEMLRELGTDSLFDKQQSLSVVFVESNGKRHELRSRLFPGKLGVMLGVLKLSSLPLTDRTAIVKLALKTLSGNAKPDSYTCTEFLTKHGQSKETIEKFWEPLILATLNTSIHVADSVMLVAVLKLAFFSGGENSKLYIPSAPLSELLEPFPNWFEGIGGRLLTHQRVENLVVEKNRIIKIVTNNNEELECHAVAACIPAHALHRLFDNNAIAEFEVSPIVNVMLWYEQEWLDVPFAAMLGTTVQWVFGAGRRQEAGGRSRVAITISAAAEEVKWSAEELIAKCDAELRAAFPALKGVKLDHGMVLKEKTATPVFKPNERNKRVVNYDLLPENMAVGGDWTDTGLPATIEGAARSGVAAIERLSQNRILQ